MRLPDFVTLADVEYFRHRYPHAPEETLRYAVDRAEEFAEAHARGALPSIKTAIGQLHFRYAMQADVGERQLIRKAIDSLLELAEALR